jgi:hypothetical protein
MIPMAKACARRLVLALLSVTSALASSWAESSELVVTSVPPRARVLIDGHTIGRTPLDLKAIPAGHYTLRVTQRGFEPFVQAIDVAERARTEVAAELIPRRARQRAGRRSWCERLAFGVGMAVPLARRHFSNGWSAKGSGTETGFIRTYTWVWEQVLKNDYTSVSNRLAPEFDLRLRISRSLALDLSAQRLTQDLKSEVAWSGHRTTVEVYAPPCPPWCVPRTTSTTDRKDTGESGTASGLSSGLSVFGLALQLRVPVARRVDLEVLAGPALFSLRQDVIRDVVSYGACRSVWPDYVGCVVEYNKVAERRVALGGQLGAVLAFGLTKQVSLVAGFRAGSAGSWTAAGLSTARLNQRVRIYTASDYVAADETLPIKLGTTFIAPRVGLRFTF